MYLNCVARAERYQRIWPSGNFEIEFDEINIVIDVLVKWSPIHEFIIRGEIR